MAGLLVWHRAKHYVLPRKFEGFKEGTMNTLYGIYHSVDAVENFSSQVKAEAVNEEVSSRCLHLMKQVHSSALRKPVIEHVLTTKDLEYTNVTLEEGAMSFEEQQRSFILGLKGMETLRERLVESVGYVVERRKSIIPGAGWGLFVRGKALPGDVIAFVPGTIYLPIEQRCTQVAELPHPSPFFLSIPSASPSSFSQLRVCRWIVGGPYVGHGAPNGQILPLFTPSKPP